MVTSIFLLNGIPVNTVSLFLAVVQTLIAMRSLKEELEMVNGYNTVVCGAHGAASCSCGDRRENVRNLNKCR